MPRSVFLGRVVKRGEPVWLDEDQSWAIALMQYEDEMCDGCGQPLSESTATKGGVHVHAYEVDAPDICAGCAALAAEMPEWEEDSRRASLKFRLIKTTPGGEHG